MRITLPLGPNRRRYFFKMNISWLKKNVIQIGVSVYSGSSLEHFKRCIQSCLAQDDVDWILAIRADGTISQNIRDFISRLVESDSRVSFEQGSTQIGTYGSYKIFENSNSEYLCQLDADDYLAEHSLSKCLSAFQENHDLSFVYTDCIDIDEQGSPLGIDSHSQTPYSKEGLLTSFMTFHLRLVSRNKFNLIGGYDDEFKYCGDYDLCLRLSEVGEVMHLKRPLYFYRLHQKSASQSFTSDLYQESLIAARRALFRRGLESNFSIDLEQNGSLILRPNEQERHKSSDEKTSLENCEIFYISPTEMH